jgi:hypothetical protein
MLTNNDIAEYDVAADALSWQSMLKNIRKFCTQYDMMPLLMIPQSVDLSKPTLIAKKPATSKMLSIIGRQGIF